MASSVPAHRDRPAAEYSREWLAQHIAEERRTVAILGEIREIVFGAQDGLVSTLAVVATVAGASQQTFPVVVAGLATGLAGIFSMAAGEYLGSKSQREIFESEIDRERQEVSERPGEAEAEVAYMFTEEGMDEEPAADLAEAMAKHPETLLRTMVSRELGLMVDDEAGSPLQGALLMGLAFGVGAVVPIAPFLFLEVGAAARIAVVATALVLFAIGVVKSRWSGRGSWRSGLETLALAAFAGVAGYFFGTILPELLGVAGIVG